MQEQEALFVDLEPVLKKAGFDLLEFTLSRHRGAVQGRAVIHAAGGTGISECSKAHRLIAAWLLERQGIEDPYLEVMSPGIDRVLRSPREFEVFCGAAVRVRREGEESWIRGRIKRLAGELLELEVGGEVQSIPLASIVKARLDSKEEGE